MKIQFSSALLCLLVLANCGFAADVYMYESYKTNDCSGDEFSKHVLFEANKCIYAPGSLSSFIYTCNPILAKTFPNADCSGDPSGTKTRLGCTKGFYQNQSTLDKCQSYPDNRLANITFGTSCGDDGKPRNGNVPRLVVIGECLERSSGFSGNSFKLVVEDDDVLSLSMFDRSSMCEGNSTVTMLKVGECQKISGYIFGYTFARVDPVVEGTKLGNNAMANSVNLLTLFIALLGATLVIMA